VTHGQTITGKECKQVQAIYPQAFPSTEEFSVPPDIGIFEGEL
jgi:hypothetical protein